MNSTACKLFTLACAAACNLVHFNEITTDTSPAVNLVVFTVATEETDVYNRFLRSARLYGVNVTVLGMGYQWQGGDIAQYPGGGQKINLLRQGMMGLQNSDDTLVMFIDSYDVVFTANPSEIVKAFRKFNANVVFSAESSCWPDQKLAIRYPEVKHNEKRFLNSGGFIGHAPEIFSIISTSYVDDSDDDQLFYTRIFLSQQRREQLKIKLDTRSSIFQNLNGALDEVTIKFKGSTSYLYNTKTGNSPIIVHGNGPIKVEFNGIANYLANQWVSKLGCLACKENTITLNNTSEESLPQVFMAIFVEQEMPFLEEFFENVEALNYPKNRIDLFLHYSHSLHDEVVENFFSSAGDNYSSVQIYNSTSGLNDWTARNFAVERFFERRCRYYLSIDGHVQLENPETLRLLIETNRSIIAPMIARSSGIWSNFWGAIANNGFYRRSFDYHNILTYRRRGIWNVPYITHMYLVHAHHMPVFSGAFIDGELDSDMAICKRLRTQGAFMHVDNQQTYGHLVNADDFETHHLHNDLYAIQTNKYTWEKKYIHARYRTTLESTTIETIDQPCHDVYWVPIVNPTFCRHLIEEMEHHGGWSSGTNEDGRVIGGYENVPTVDIHANQIGWEASWLYFLKHYIAPLSSKLFMGYISESRATMNFVVRYRPGEQDRLHPHSDASTYTINIALNMPGINYEGGGTHFLRYNCSVTKSRRGWMLLHPGRLTHYHEGLPTVKGTRYIMVSFIDP